MITATLLYEKGAVCGFTCSGHAGRGAYGNDLVCSAVSAITQTCVIGITEVLGLNAEVSVDEDNGIACRLPTGPDDDRQRQAALLIQTMAAGLRSVQAAYPGTLKTIDKEV